MAEPGDEIMILVDGVPIPTYIDDNGVQRFRQNEILCYMLDKGVFDLNKLYIEVLTQKLNEYDYMDFYMSLGYSVSGFNEIFGPGSSWEDNGQEPVQILNPMWLEPGTVH